MLPRLCVAVAGPAIICSLFSPTNASAQAGTLTAAVSGFVEVPAGPVTNNQSVDGGGAIALRYAPNALPQAAVRFELSGLVPSRHDKSGPDSPAAEDANGAVPAVITDFGRARKPLSTILAWSGGRFDAPELRRLSFLRASLLRGLRGSFGGGCGFRLLLVLALGVVTLCHDQFLFE